MIFDDVVLYLKFIKKRYYQRKEYNQWKKKGKPLPPPHYSKQLTIREYKRRYLFRILIESGTFMGEMVEAQRRNFDRIISIELSESLHKKAALKFKEYKNIEILCGDSGKIIASIVPALEGSAIFWLDGHYSGGNTAKGDIETPILGELEAILSSKNEHVILIDDARLFTGSNDYPTVEYVHEFAKKYGYELSVKDDIIRVTKMAP